MRRQRAGLRSARRSQRSDVKSGAMACPFVLTALGVMWLLASQPDGQVREPASQQERIIDAIGEMMQHTQRVRGNDPDVADLALEADRHLRWLLNNAKRWVPATAGEGSALRESLERMTTALRDVAQDTNTVKLLWEAIRDDLAEKVAYLQTARSCCDPSGTSGDQAQWHDRDQRSGGSLPREVLCVGCERQAASVPRFQQSGC